MVNSSTQNDSNKTKEQLLSEMHELKVRLDLYESNEAKAIQVAKVAEQRFKILFEQSGTFCMILDPNTADGIPIIINANKAACEAHGYTREEFIGRPVSSIDDPVGKKLILDRTHHMLDGEFMHIENTHVRKDGSTFPVEIYANQVSIEGEPPLIFTTEHDISNRKRLELERETAFEKLEKALSEIKTLQGIIPICSYCHNMRDNEGSWNQIAAYISAHTEAQFSHGICPKCLIKARAEAGLDNDED